MQEIFLAVNRISSLLLLLALCAFGCTSSQDDVSESEPKEQLPGMDKMSPEEVAGVLEGGFETIGYAIKTATCGELAFKFDVDLSERLLAASFEAHTRYFENLREPLFGRDESEWAIRGSRERAALAIGRILGSTDVRLTQKLREQGGGDAIAAAREQFRSYECPSQ